MAIRTSHHDLAKDPNNIEKIVKVDLPDIAFVSSSAKDADADADDKKPARVTPI